MNNVQHYPRLIADIGGTNARFSIERKPLQLDNIQVFRCADFPTLFAVIQHYLSQVSEEPAHVVIAIANPVIGNEIKMTNHHWQFSISEMKAQLGIETLLVMNDFTAQALSVEQVDPVNLSQIGGKKPDNIFPIAVVGPGTGLGVSGLIPDAQGRMIPLSGEGGHVAFAPYDETERRLLAFAEKEFQYYVSAERLLCGAGLSLLYRFFAMEAGKIARDKTPAEVTKGALIDSDPICLRTLSRYCLILGGFCADVVLTIGAMGGVYLCGGIVPRFTDFLKASDFRMRFEAKGRFAHYMEPVAVYVVGHPQPGLLGAAVALDLQLKLSE
ncbi:MAG: glucokinase [Ostreibacterium sp.]